VFNGGSKRTKKSSVGQSRRAFEKNVQTSTMSYMGGKLAKKTSEARGWRASKKKQKACTNNSTMGNGGGKRAKKKKDPGASWSRLY
jgi:hypothetical protein